MDVATNARPNLLARFRGAISLSLAVAALAVAVQSTAQTSPNMARKADANHKRGICGQIVKLDLLLYNAPSNPGSTATCSYTDERLLIRPKQELPPDRMKRFVFLAFAAAGSLFNDDYMLPPKTYVGFGTECQVLSTRDAGEVNSLARQPGTSGMYHATLMIAEASKVPCPK